MSEIITVAEIVFALKEVKVNIDSALRRRIEWVVGQGNYEWPEERLRDELSKFVLQKNSSLQSLFSDKSIDDFLCERGISLKAYYQLIQHLEDLSLQPSLLSKAALDQLDIDSRVIKFAQNHPAQEVFLNTLRASGLSHEQCRLILGLSKKSYVRLKKRLQVQQSEELGRRGRSEDDAWSFAKHIVSERCLAQFLEGSNKSSNFILETHQGVGDATFLYQHYGHVVGFEKKKEAHQIIMERAQNKGVFRNMQDFYMRRLVANPLSDLQSSRVFVPNEATPCEKGLEALVNQGIYFDVIDVDPWSTSMPHFPNVNQTSETEVDVLGVLKSPGMVMLTVGDQHPWPKGEPLAWERFGVEAYNFGLSEEERRNWRKSWIFLRLVSAWYMRAATMRSICLLPILIMRNFEPWLPREDFSSGVLGVDRIYFVGRRVFDMDKLEDILRFWTEPMPIFGNDILRTQISTQTRPSGAIGFIGFVEEIWPVMKPFWPKYHQWLLETSEDLPTRWGHPQPEIDKVRNQLRQAIDEVCSDKIAAGYNLANNWLNTL